MTLVYENDENCGTSESMLTIKNLKAERIVVIFTLSLSSNLK